MSHERLKIGLALGGGAARGIAHIGILQTLEKAEIPIDYIAGTSAGSLVGALYASGVSLQYLQKFALKLKWIDMFFPRPTLRSLVSSKRLVKLLHKYCRAVRFEDLHIPLSVTASDFETGKSVVMTEGDLFPAVRASCSVPLICPPVRLDGRYYIDGGFAAELPVHAAREMGADIVVACDVHYKTELLSKPKNVFITLKHLMRLTAQRNAEEAKTYADIAINVDISGIGLMDLHKGRELLQRGRQATEAVLPELKKKLKL